MANNKKITNYTGSATEISIPTSIGGNLVREIDTDAFKDKNITKITVNTFNGDISGSPWGATNAQIVWAKSEPQLIANIYWGLKNPEPTDVTGLTKVTKTKTELLNNGFSITVSPDMEYPTLAIDKDLNIKLSRWESVGFDMEFTEVSAANQYIYYINGPDDPVGDGTAMTYTFNFVKI